MSFEDLLKQVQEAGVELWLEADQLRFRAPKGALTAAQRAELSAHRVATVELLRRQAGEQVSVHPLSFSQRSLWFLHQQAPQSTAYHVAMSVRVHSAVDTVAMRQALQALLDRHAILRTTYVLDEEGPRQRVAGAIPVAFEVTESSADEAELRESVEREYRRVFDLERGPVFRASLFSQSRKQHVLLLTVHHIAADGWSLLLLFQELRSLYAEFAGGPAAALARPKTQYTDYVAWQEGMLSGAEGARLWDYWRSKLANLPAPPELPLDRPRAAAQTFIGASVSLRFNHELVERLRLFSRKQGTTLFVVLLASFHVFLQRLTTAEDIVIGTPTFGRSKPEFVEVVGDFVNSVPVRASFDRALTFRGLVDQLRNTMLEALDAQEYPLSLLVQRLQIDRTSSRSLLFDTFFLLQRFDQFKEMQNLLVGQETASAVDFGGLRVSAYPLHQQEGQFDLALQLVDSGTEVNGVLTYASDLFDDATIRALAAEYERLLVAIDRDPDSILYSLPRLDAGRTTAAPVAAKVREFIKRLAERDIRMHLEGGKLRVNAPKGAMTEELKAEIAGIRDQVIVELAAAPEGHGIPLRAIPRDGWLAVSSAQQRLWFLDQIDPGRSHYNVALGARLRGPLDRVSLSRAVDDLIARHESLRLRFIEIDGAPYVETLPGGRDRLEIIDLSHMESERCEAEANRLSNELLQAPFDLATGPLAAFRLVALRADYHWLTVCMHHIISDGWSLFLAIREICQSYGAIEAGGTAPPPASPVQYADYAAWEQAQLHSGAMTKHLSYWKMRLAGAPSVLELPTDHPRPALQSFRGARYRAKFAPGLLEALKALSLQNGATLYMTLLAAWQVLLYRYSGQTDIVVGSPMANRELPQLEGLIGCFVNNVVLRAELDGREPFCDFLAATRRNMLEAFDHRDLPFEVLVEALRPERSASHSPIFQVLFALQSFPMNIAAPAKIKLSMAEPQTQTARFDLALEIVEYGGGFGGLYEYATDLFDEATISRMHEHMQQLLQSIVAAPRTRLQDLQILPLEEEQRILSTVDTSFEHDRSLCVHQLLEASVRSFPDAVAVVAAEEAVSFAEVEQRANRLANLLHSRGIRRGDLVAVCLDRTVDMPIALAAVLKAGAAYVPLDPTHPAERLRFTLADAGVACVITLRRFTESFESVPPALDVPLIILDEIGAELATQVPTPPDVMVGADDLAYVIYTSGSTGRPKGVQVAHANVVSFLAAMRREPGFSNRDSLLAVTTLSFDIAGLELWLPLSTGGRIVVASRSDVLDGQRLIALLQEHQVTVMQATPATWRIMLEAGWRGKPDLRIFCGGEALPRDLAAALLPKVAELWNMYGPTETTIWSTVSRVQVGDKSILIGRPIANTRTFVLEPSGQLAPVGVAGELCIAGEGVACGYRNRDELSAEKFVTLSLAGKPERVYRTGDLARLQAGGQLEFIGRRDHQVKVRGYRIELGEIEAVLAAHPGVKECVVVVRTDSADDQRLVGYIVRSGESPFDAEAARSTLRIKLPEYMLPGSFVELDALPLTPNGKIDRKALPAPYAAARPMADQNASLMTPAQRRVVAIWQNVLHIERVGLHDNFFDLGGHSLLLVKLHAALKREFAIDLALVELFQRTTVASQADRLSAPKAADGSLLRARERAARQANA